MDNIGMLGNKMARLGNFMLGRGAPAPPKSSYYPASDPAADVRHAEVDDAQSIDKARIERTASGNGV